MENITEFIKNRNNLITNIDPDGIFSFVLLHKFFKSDLVGFTNSKEYVYLVDNKNTNRHEVTYVDMYVSKEDIQSIDQHIISFNEGHNAYLQKLGTKLNPNIWHNRSFINYKIKYPFSTFLYICTLLEKEGYDLDINFHQKITDKLELGHILLRIDGVITNLSDYSDNCRNWLKWSLEYTNNSKFIKNLCEFIRTSVPAIDTRIIAKDVEDYLKQNFSTETKDGGFKTINSDNFSNIKRMFEFASNLLKDDDLTFLNDIHTLTIYRGDKAVTAPLTQEQIAKEIFSYAIVNMKEENFSYTKNIQEFKKVIL